ncbi:MAG: cellobiose phosphorylase [Phycisphaerae bacterium]
MYTEKSLYKLHTHPAGWEFTISDYHRSKPFSSFLPGIAGPWGVPLWLYYVNRGQAVACFGTEDKNHAIVQFESANLHHRRVAMEGFRTFIRPAGGGEAYEPFRAELPEGVRNSLTIGIDSLRLEEVNEQVGLTVTVDYFAVPNEPFAALARSVTLRNTGRADMELEVLDGLPKVVPFAVPALLLQRLPYITEAYLQVSGLEERVGLLNLSAVPSDTPETQFVDEAHFFFGLDGASAELLPPIVDPSLIFGDYLDLTAPHALRHDTAFDPTARQDTHCMTPCAFIHWPVTLPAGQSRTLRTLIGRAPDADFAKSLPKRAGADGWFERKADQSRREVRKVRDHMLISSSSELLDAYASQTFLDNCLRGGLPMSIPGPRGRSVLHVYSRRHGDLERDYNHFRLQATYLSQGNGAFRDVNQNRRNDVWFNPDVSAENVRLFFNLIQPDGYNPLQVMGCEFTVSDTDKLQELLERNVEPAGCEEAARLLAGAFDAGELMLALERRGVRLRVGREEFLGQLLEICEKSTRAEFETGYWTDHWTYNLDLLESFLGVFPDRTRELLIDSREFTYRDTDVYVRPRDDKTVRLPDGRVRRLGAVARDGAKSALIASRRDRPHCVRLDDGEGEIHRTNLLEKLVCLLAVKAATISPSGMGLDMEADRPGWHDSVNGLPALFGASVSETFHLLRGIRLMRRMLHEAKVKDDYSQQAPAEIVELFQAVTDCCRQYLADEDSERDHTYWQRTCEARESYRRRVHRGFSGRMQKLSVADIRGFLDLAEQRVLASLPKALDEQTGLYATYITHEAVDYEPIGQTDDAAGMSGSKLNHDGLECVRVNRFRPHLLPAFLEAPTHALRIEQDPAKAARMVQDLRKSTLYDRKLGMYILSDSVRDESPELGRIYAWPPGWFENENVFLHMEHKLLLAMLQAGRYEEFFADMRRCMVCFQDPDTYGRCPLENASFIVSSRHPRPGYHGRGFLPRTSGTTAEVVHMLLIMSFGQRPFRIADGELALKLEPVLPEWLFTDTHSEREIIRPDGSEQMLRFPADSYSALFLGKVVVTYLNPSRKSTFGDNAAAVTGYRLFYNDGREDEHTSDTLTGKPAHDVRDGRVLRVEVRLA